MRGGGRQGVQGVQRASLDPRVDRRSDQRRHLAASPGSDGPAAMQTRARSRVARFARGFSSILWIPRIFTGILPGN